MSQTIKALVDAGIEVKLTKSDLVDMMTSEHEEALETKLNLLIEEKNKNEETFSNVATDLIKSRFSQAKAHLASSKSKIGKVANVLNIPFDKLKYSLEGGAATLPHGMSFVFNSCSYDYRPTISNAFEHSRKIIGDNIFPMYGNGKTLFENIRIQLFYEENSDNEKGIGDFSETISPKFTSKELKLSEALGLCYLRMVELKKEIAAIKEEIKDIGKMGARAKSRLVREMLSSTNEGKILLDSMSKAVKGTKLLKS